VKEVIMADQPTPSNPDHPSVEEILKGQKTVEEIIEDANSGANNSGAKDTYKN
jgi:hypothetical protein